MTITALNKDRFTIYRSKFFYLLCSLIIYFLCTALLVGQEESTFLLSIFFSFIVFACLYIIAVENYQIKIMGILAGAALIIHWLITLYSNDKIFYLGCYAFNVCFLAYATYAVLYSIGKHNQITADTLFGAICGYFFLGFTWAYVYLFLATLYPNSFSHQAITHSFHESTQHFYYYSFTTMTTSAFGDILPVTNIARTLSWLEAIAGQAYLAVWISQLVGLRIAQNHSKA